MSAQDPSEKRPESAEPQELDPFSEFNRAQGIGSVRDPYPQLADRRRQCPVHKQSAKELFGDSVQVPPDLGDVYTVYSHDAVSHVLRDGQTFSSQGNASSRAPSTLTESSLFRPCQRFPAGLGVGDDVHGQSPAIRVEGPLTSSGQAVHLKALVVGVPVVIVIAVGVHHDRF